MFPSKSIRQKIDPDEFERMVTRDGYSMAEYAKLKNLGCTAERLRQVANSMGLKHSPHNRTHKWRIARKKRLNNDAKQEPAEQSPAGIFILQL